MSTCNFSQPKELDRIYAIALNESGEPADEFQYEDEKENIQCELEAIKGYNLDESKWLDRETHTLGYFYIPVYNKEEKTWEEPAIYVTIEAGYFEGAKIDMDCSELDIYEINKTTQAKIDAIKNKVQKILRAYTLNLVRVAVFSNGEGIYKKISK